MSKAHKGESCQGFLALPSDVRALVAILCGPEGLRDLPSVCKSMGSSLPAAALLARSMAAKGAPAEPRTAKELLLLKRCWPRCIANVALVSALCSFLMRCEVVHKRSFFYSLDKAVSQTPDNELNAMPLEPLAAALARGLKIEDKEAHMDAMDDAPGVCRELLERAPGLAPALVQAGAMQDLVYGMESLTPAIEALVLLVPHATVEQVREKNGGLCLMDVLLAVLGDPAYEMPHAAKAATLAAALAAKDPALRAELLVAVSWMAQLEGDGVLEGNEESVAELRKALHTLSSAL